MSLGRLCFGLAYSNNVASVKESKFASFLRDQCFSLQAILEKERVHFYAEPLSSSPRFPFFSSTSGSVLLLITIPITGLELLFSLCSKTSGSAPLLIAIPITGLELLLSLCSKTSGSAPLLLAIPITGLELLSSLCSKNLWFSPTSYCHTYHWAGITLLTLFKKPLVQPHFLLPYLSLGWNYSSHFVQKPLVQPHFLLPYLSLGWNYSSHFVQKTSGSAPLLIAIPITGLELLFSLCSKTSGSAPLLLAIPITGLELLFSLCSKNLWFSPTSYCHTYHWAGITLLTLFKKPLVQPHFLLPYLSLGWNYSSHFVQKPLV